MSFVVSCSPAYRISKKLKKVPCFRLFPVNLTNYLLYNMTFPLLTRIGNIIRGFTHMLVGGVEKRNPEALLELEKENLRKQISNYNSGLASHAGGCERLMGQVKRLEKEEKDLGAKIRGNLAAGNREAAEQYALRHQTVKGELEENRAQLKDSEATYQRLIQARDVTIRAAQAKLETLKNSLSSLKIKKATAEMNEMASGMIGEIGGRGDTLDRLHEMVSDETAKVAGRARVAQDSLDMSGISLQAAEQKALAGQALADFAAEAGIVLGGDAPVAEKAMGAEESTPAVAEKAPAAKKMGETA